MILSLGGCTGIDNFEVRRWAGKIEERQRRSSLEKNQLLHKVFSRTLPLPSYPRGGATRRVLLRASKHESMVASALFDRRRTLLQETTEI
jgi:hypothetical protein